MTVVIIITLMNIIAICAITIVPTIAVVITFIAVINIRIFASLSILITNASIMLVVITAITVDISSISSITIIVMFVLNHLRFKKTWVSALGNSAINVYFALVNCKPPRTCTWFFGWHKSFCSADFGSLLFLGGGILDGWD